MVVETKQMKNNLALKKPKLNQILLLPGRGVPSRKCLIKESALAG
jgi:DNA-binding transcriptional regulator YdaS (Cro superfamily)